MSTPGQSTATGEWSLRSSLVALLVVATLVTFTLIGIAILAYRVPAIMAEDREHMRNEAVGLAHYFEQLIDSLEGRLGTLAALDMSMSPRQIQRFLDSVIAEGGFKAIYVLNPKGHVEYVALPEEAREARANVVGADLSRNPLLASVRTLGRRAWSDRYLSALTGDATIGLAIPFDGYTLLGEVAPGFASEVLQAGTEDLIYPVLVVDRAGEYVVGRNLAESDRLRNWAAELNGVSPGRMGDVRQIRFAGRPYDTGLARSDKLQWTFMVAYPTGMDNPRVRVTIALVLVGFVGSILLALVLAPLWAVRMSAPLQDLIAQTRALTSGTFGGKVSRGRILEFNQLAADMESMATAIRERQGELEKSEERLLQSLQNVQQLNLLLEHRVELRTIDLERANRELSEAMETLKLAQGELVRNETLASLGNLVGGVAHELNTPIGNGVMAVSTMHDQVRTFRREMANGLRRSTLEAFVERVERGSEIAVRNLQRANELITSFKQVAVDQTSAQRRRFKLSEVIDEILMTLQPTLKRTPFRVERQIPDDLVLESYPGPLGQVLTNLLTNALTHGFEGRTYGLIRVSAERHGDDQIILRVADDGAGIQPDLFPRIFDPFVTSKLGRGGSGLGLHIVWNTVTVVLGGSITVNSTSEQGTEFRIILPLVAPRQPNNG